MPDARLAVHGSDELDGHERVEAEADQRAFEVEPIGQGVEHAGGAFGHVPLERGGRRLARVAARRTREHEFDRASQGSARLLRALAPTPWRAPGPAPVAVRR
jgi:hypothetical protein